MKLNFESASLQSHKIPNLPQIAVGLFESREFDSAKRAIRKTAEIVTHAKFR